MLKKFLRRLLKVILVLVLITLTASAIGFGIAFFNKNSELDRINSLYKDAQENLNRSEEEKELTINDLKDSFLSLNKQVEILKNENKDLKEKNEGLEQTGMSKIEGSIATVVTNETSFTQFQLVCAEDSENSNLKWCISVSAISGTYSLLVPAGKYKVYAQIITKEGGVSNTRAYYTELVKCSREKSSNQCDSSLAGKPVIIETVAGKTTSQINPIDWSI